MVAPPRPILFASAAHPGQLNPLLAIAGELSRRRVPQLWFAAEEAARDRVAQTVAGSAVRFLSTGDTVLRVDESLYAAMTRGPRTTAGTVALARMIRDPAVTDPLRTRTLAQIDRVRPRLMVIDVLHVGALDAAVARGIPFVLSVPFPVSGVYLGRLPWGYPTPTSGLPARMSTAQRLANVGFRLRLRLALLAHTNPGAVLHRRTLGISNVFADPERYSRTAAAVFGYSVFGLEHPFPVPGHLHMLGAVLPATAGSPDDADARELAGWLDRRPVRRVRRHGHPGPALRDPATGAGRGVGPAGTGAPGAVEAAARAARLAAGAAARPHPGPRLGAVAVRGAGPPARARLRLARRWQRVPRGCALRSADAGDAVLDGLLRPGRARGRRRGRAGPGPAARASTPTRSHGKLRRLLTEDSFRRRSRHWGERLRRAGGARRAAELVLRAAAAEPGPARPVRRTQPAG